MRRPLEVDTFSGGIGQHDLCGALSAQMHVQVAQIVPEPKDIAGALQVGVAPGLVEPERPAGAEIAHFPGDAVFFYFRAEKTIDDVQVVAHKHRSHFLLRGFPHHILQRLQRCLALAGVEVVVNVDRFDPHRRTRALKRLQHRVEAEIGPLPFVGKNIFVGRRGVDLALVPNRSAERRYPRVGRV